MLTKYSRSSAYRVRDGGRDLQVGNRRYGLFGCHAGNNRVGGVHLVGDGIELRTDIGKELLELPIPVFVDFIAGHLFDFQGDAVDLVDYVLKLFKGFIQGGGRALEGQGMLPSLEIEACRAAVHADGMGFDAGTGIGEGVALHLAEQGPPVDVEVFEHRHVGFFRLAVPQGQIIHAALFGAGRYS